MRIRTTVLTFWLLVFACAAAGAAEVTAIKAGRVLTMSGDPVTDGVILIENGKIAEIGPEVEIPDNATVIEAGDSVAMPGFVDASAVAPIRGDLNEQSLEIKPSLRISNALDPKSKTLKRVVQTGVTTLLVSPGRQNVIGGLGAVDRVGAEGLHFGERIEVQAQQPVELHRQRVLAADLTLGSGYTWVHLHH